MAHDDRAGTFRRQSSLWPAYALLPEHRTPFGGGSGLDGDAVSVLAVGGTAEVLPRAGAGTVAEILDPLADALAGGVRAAADPTRMSSTAQAVVLPPEVAGPGWIGGSRAVHRALDRRPWQPPAPARPSQTAE